MTDPTSTAPAPLGLVARFIGVITAPRATFENVVAAPRPFGILLAVALLISVASAVPQFTESGRQAALDMQVKSMERMGVTVTPEMYTALEHSSRSPLTKVWGVLGALIFLPIVALFFAALYWAFFNTALGGTANFKQVLAIVTHSYVIGALDYVARLPLQLMQGTTMTMAGPFNLGALAPMLEDGLLKSVLEGLSVFTVWGCIVTGIGLGVLYRRSARNISIGLIIVSVLWVVVVATVVRAFFGGGAS